MYSHEKDFFFVTSQEGSTYTPPLFFFPLLSMYMYILQYMHPSLNPYPETYTHALKKKRGATNKRERKRAKEERDSKLCRRCRACDINESRAPRTFFLASTVAPASSSARTVSLCPFSAEM